MSSTELVKLPFLYLRNSSGSDCNSESCLNSNCISGERLGVLVVSTKAEVAASFIPFTAFLLLGSPDKTGRAEGRLSMTMSPTVPDVMNEPDPREFRLGPLELGPLKPRDPFFRGRFLRPPILMNDNMLEGGEQGIQMDARSA